MALNNHLIDYSIISMLLNSELVNKETRFLNKFYKPLGDVVSEHKFEF